MNSQHWPGFTFSGLIPQSPLNENSSALQQDDFGDLDHPSVMDQDVPLIDISRKGLWTLSSGRTDPKDDECFLDADNLESFWWTGLPAGIVPLHWAMVRFPRIVHVSKLELYLNHAQDQTWCPRIISVWAGTNVQHLTCILPGDEERFKFSNPPEGWQTFDLTVGNKGRPVPCSVVKVQFEQNFSNGQNLRLRGLKLFASPSDRVEPGHHARLLSANIQPATPRPVAARNPSYPIPDSTPTGPPQWQISLLSSTHRPDPLR